jgi:hypothetical protein
MQGMVAKKVLLETICGFILRGIVVRWNPNGSCGLGCLSIATSLTMHRGMGGLMDSQLGAWLQYSLICLLAVEHGSLACNYATVGGNH